MLENWTSKVILASVNRMGSGVYLHNIDRGRKIGEKMKVIEIDNVRRKNEKNDLVRALNAGPVERSNEQAEL